MKNVKSYDKFNESRGYYIVGSYPLEELIRLKKRLDRITSNLEFYENHVVKETNDDKLDEYSDLVTDVQHLISTLHNNSDLQALEIGLDDFQHEVTRNKN